MLEGVTLREYNLLKVLYEKAWGYDEEPSEEKGEEIIKCVQELNKFYEGKGE